MFCARSTIQASSSVYKYKYKINKCRSNSSQEGLSPPKTKNSSKISRENKTLNPAPLPVIYLTKILLHLLVAQFTLPSHRHVVSNSRKNLELFCLGSPPFLHPNVICPAPHSCFRSGSITQMLQCMKRGISRVP